MASAINPRKILVVEKLSKLEYDRHRLDLGQAALMRKYQREGANWRGILSSHARQLQARERLRRVFSSEQFIPRNEMTEALAARASLVIAAGGDNHFQFVSHFLDQTPILGLNTDSLRSEGALTLASVRSVAFLEGLLRKLERGDFAIEPWTRLETRINGETLGRATCDCLLGELVAFEMSRHILRVHGKREEQKGSGLLVATGAGSTGWYDSACEALYPDGNPFPRTAPFARFWLRERYRGHLTGYRMREGKIGRGEKIIVQSLNDSEGVAVHDSLDRLPFARGARAEIFISDHPLRALRVSDLL